MPRAHGALLADATAVRFPVPAEATEYEVNIREKRVGKFLYGRLHGRGYRGFEVFLILKAVGSLLMAFIVFFFFANDYKFSFNFRRVFTIS